MKHIHYALVIFALLISVQPILAQDVELNICWIESGTIHSQDGVIIDIETVELPREAHSPDHNEEQGFKPYISIWSFDFENDTLVFAGRISYGRHVGQESYDTNGDGEFDAWSAWDSPDQDQGIFIYNQEENSIEAIWLESINVSETHIQGISNLDLSPSGSIILFDAEQYGPNTGGDSEIFIIQVTGGNPAQITRNHLGDMYPIWEDDTTILYNQNNSLIRYTFNINQTEVLFEESWLFGIQMFGENRIVNRYGTVYNKEGEILDRLYTEPFGQDTENERFIDVFQNAGDILISTRTETDSYLYLNGEEIASSQDSFLFNPRICGNTQ